MVVRSLVSCPPEKAVAMAKVRSMLAIASAQLHRLVQMGFIDINYAILYE